MLAVIIDEKSEEIQDYLLKKSCSELSLLSCSLIEKQVAELKSCGINRVAFLGNKNSEADCEMICFDKCNKLADYIEKTEEKSIVIVSSAVYFEMKNDVMFSDFSNLTRLNLTDNEGEIACAIFNGKDVSAILSSVNVIYELPEIIFSRKNTSVKCVDFACKVENIRNYKKLLNMILNMKTNIHLPEIAEGIYSEGEIPKGDYVIVPPVYFGGNVQVESGSVIGPYTIVESDSLISKNTYVKKSFISNNGFVSSGCFLDGVFCGENVSVRKDSAVFADSILGNNVVLSEETIIENGSLIRPFTHVSNAKNNIINYKENESLSGFCGYTPEKAALLGGAIGSHYKKEKIVIMCNGECNSVILKHALISGLLSTGNHCFDCGFGFLSSIIFVLMYCDIKIGVFIQGFHDGTIISVIKKDGFFISKSEFYCIKEKMLNGNIVRCNQNECGQLHTIRKIKNLYVNNLVKNISNSLNVFPVFNCRNKIINDIVKCAFSKLKCNNFKNKIYFTINETGTRVDCVCNGGRYNHEKLQDFVAFYDDINISKNWQNMRNDAVYLCFKVLEIIASNNLDFSTEIENIPLFFVAEKILESDKKIPYIASRFSTENDVLFSDSSLLVKDKNFKIKVIENDNIKKLKIFAKSYKYELAEEIALEVERFLKNMI